ncbi:hypothetical protein HPP92_013193 [Vanilla planifolia]|uniref:ATP-dependent RNA helicase Ski2/MTR4 C-terminal domain-containing protein n=1 Tax=Vanilla planifolia TaxID=51239 RepID=A0A835QTL6_VANPL|nr:hypothetical protein HPP92_013193 [Vanilla planifolia]
MKVNVSSYRKAVRRIENWKDYLTNMISETRLLIKQNLQVLHHKKELMAKIKSIKKSMRSSTALAFKDELKARKRVLRRLDIRSIKSDHRAALKSTILKVHYQRGCREDEGGAFKEISIEEMERLQDARKPREELQLLFSQLQETARRVANVNLDCKVQVDVESFVNSFRFDIMEAVHAWTKGSKFFEIMEMSQVFEGSLIRAIRRLEEVLQQLALAAKSIGETDLEAKFVEAVAKIKRDIVFAASLYL